MHAARRVEHGVLVRVVLGTRPHQLADQHALSGEATPRQQDCTPSVTDDARVHKDALRCHLRDVELHVCLKGPQARLQRRTPGQQRIVDVHRVLVPARPVTLFGDQRIHAACVEELRTLGAGWEMTSQAFGETQVVGPDANADAVCHDRQACLPLDPIQERCRHVSGRCPPRGPTLDAAHATPAAPTGSRSDPGCTRFCADERTARGAARRPASSTNVRTKCSAEY